MTSRDTCKWPIAAVDPPRWQRGTQRRRVGFARGLQSVVGWGPLPLRVASFILLQATVTPSQGTHGPSGNALDSKRFLFFLIKCQRVRAKSLQSWPTLCNPMDCSPPGSSVHGIL